MRIDLHMHSVYSDGDLTPAQLIDRAVRLGLDAVSLTDHDTDAGTAEFRAAGKEAGIRSVNGIELSAHAGREIHILGYRVPLSSESESFRRDLAVFKEGRARRAERMTDCLRELGLDVRFAELERMTRTPTRLHLARLLTEKGYAESEREAYRRYLEPGKPGFVPYEERDPRIAVQAIVRAGGIAVLAHPGRLGLHAKEIERLVRSLKEAGLRGIECCYPTHTNIEKEAYRRIADRCGLIVTNGSDFHRAAGLHTHGFAFDVCDADPRAEEELGL